MGDLPESLMLLPIGVLALDLTHARRLIDDYRLAVSGEQSLDQAFACALTASVTLLDANPAARSLILQRWDEGGARLADLFPETLQKSLAKHLVLLLERRPFTMAGSLRGTDGVELDAQLCGWVDSAENSGLDKSYLSVTIVERPETRQPSQSEILGELAHTARISLLGEMTASISHEVNQPLSSIVTSAEAGLRWLNNEKPDLDEVRILLDRIAKSGRRASAIVSALKGLARNAQPVRELTDLASLVDEAVAILRSELTRRQVGLRLEMPQELPQVIVDRTQILQVVVNLVTNAAEAMADGQAWNRTLAIRAKPEPGWVTVEVEDSGPGVDPRVRDQMFDSFSTTKKSGVGIGLAICRSIIEAHGSTIELQSSQYLGARFSFRLEATDG